MDVLCEGETVDNCTFHQLPLNCAPDQVEPMCVITQVIQDRPSFPFNNNNQQTNIDSYDATTLLSISTPSMDLLMSASLKRFLFQSTNKPHTKKKTLNSLLPDSL
jgi:hypothetical protein